MTRMKRILRAFLWPATRGGKVRMLVAAVLLVIVTIAGCGSGNRLFYFPNDLVYNDPSGDGLRYEADVAFASADGTMLHGWFIPAQPGPARATVIYFHGNAQNLTAHYAFVSWLPREGYNVFLFDYRGFGRSEGAATREGTFLDSVAALRYVHGREDVDADRLLGFGQSLGGALMLAALGETDPHQVRGIAVESTFHSYQGVAQEHLARQWWAWLVQWPLSRWLVTDHHSPSHSLENLAGVPLLIIHGDADEIVPYNQGKRLHERAPQPKQFIHVPGGTHCEGTGGYRFGTTYRKQLLEFFEACLKDAR